jgi:transcription antitermination factor NusG
MIFLDNTPDTCQIAPITAPVPETDTDAPCHRIGGNPEEISSKWGGPRANSGGPRANSGGARPGAGRPRRNAPTIPAYAAATPVWCVIAFWGQAEISGTRELTREGYETCLPLQAIRRQDPVIKSMWHTVRIPLFSGYGFIRLTQAQSREPVTSIRGVREVLRRPDGKAAWVPDALIEKLVEDAPRRLELAKQHGPVLDAGSGVRIKDGTFEGHRGVVIQCDGINTQVEIEMFGRPVPVWLDRVSVEVV